MKKERRRSLGVLGTGPERGVMSRRQGVARGTRKVRMIEMNDYAARHIEEGEKEGR